MKRTLLLLALVLVGLTAVAYGLMRPTIEQRSRVRARDARIAEVWAHSPPLVLDAATQGILAHADRAETFRLESESDGEAHTAAESAAIAALPEKLVQNHRVMRIGQPQGHELSIALSKALAQADSQQSFTQCFDPGVAFRVWQGKAHTDISICFFCSAMDITTENANHKVLYHYHPGLRYSRPALLALSRQAFPGDKQLMALK